MALTTSKLANPTTTTRLPLSSIHSAISYSPSSPTPAPLAPATPIRHSAKTLHAPYVREVFSNITTGTSVPPGPGTQSRTPTFICVDARDQVSDSENDERVDAYIRCRAQCEAPAIALLRSPYAVICPLFFTLASIPAQSTASCLTIDSHRKDGKSLIKYQLWHVLPELVHYYVYSTVQDYIDIYKCQCLLRVDSECCGVERTELCLLCCE